jgi:uncharacterized protein DUF4326
MEWGAEMNAPRRIRLSRAKGWRMPPNTVHVARGKHSVWGNPFVVGKYGTAAECVHAFERLLAGYITIRKEPHPEAQLETLEHFRSHAGELRGKNLACWCALDQPCHADVLLRLANGGTG